MAGILQSRALVPLSVADHDGCRAGEDERQGDPCTASLLNVIARVVKCFVVLPEGGPEAFALWVLHAHAHDAAQISPILALVSPEKRCGKTTALSVLHCLVPRPWLTSNTTAAGIFHAVDQHSPTLLIDEFDSFSRRHSDLRCVLNSGHSRAGAFVLRSGGRYSTWSPKVLALIGKLPDTLMDRSIVVGLKRRRPDESIEPFRMDRASHLEVAGYYAQRWGAHNVEWLRSADPEMPPELNDRAADNWRPLIAIADLAGSDWSDRARSAAVLLSSDDDAEDESAATMLLSDIKALFQECGADRMWSSELAIALAQREDRPWSEWKGNRPITKAQVAVLLKPFDIRPGVMRIGSKTSRGYRLDMFTDAFSRYLPRDA
jgi:hypothetical protein